MRAWTTDERRTAQLARARPGVGGSRRDRLPRSVSGRGAHILPRDLRGGCCAPSRRRADRRRAGARVRRLSGRCSRRERDGRRGPAPPLRRRSRPAVARELLEGRQDQRGQPAVPLTRPRARRALSRSGARTRKPPRDDLHLDVENRVAERADEIRVGLEGFQSALRVVGRHMPADALVLIETTVPMGTCERIALPILREERARRGIQEPVLLANAYERVMPGPAYVDSIRSLSRTFAGIDQESAERAKAFLKTVIDTDGHPLWQLEDTVSSELGKLLENSYRSVNIAFIHEWTLLAEQIGVNLFEVVDSIRVRKGTHDNMRYPGFGVGGYCLTKDSLLAQWSAAHLFGADAVLEMTLSALRTNYEMPLHTFDLVEELAETVAGKTIAVLGVSYLAGVADTRSSPTEILVDRLLEAGAGVRVHDPLVTMWYERPEIEVLQDLSSALTGADGVVLAVPHDPYLALTAQELLEHLSPHAFVVDAQDIVSDEKARALHEGGRRVVGVGKGHWRTRGYQSTA